MELRDRYGWPVERFIGRPIINFIRLLIHTNLRATWKYRNKADFITKINQDFSPGADPEKEQP